MYKGSTSDFGSESRGSNPLRATIIKLIGSCHNDNKRVLSLRFGLGMKVPCLVLLVEKLIALFFFICTECVRTIIKKKSVDRDDTLPTDYEI